MNEADQMIHAERVDRLVAAIEAAFPTGWSEFDVAWLQLRRDRPGVPPLRCPTTRMLVGRLADELDAYL